MLLLTSGAMATGRHILGVSQTRGDIPFRQVLSAVGQGRLMQVYEEMFASYGIHVAQALPTRSALSDRLGYLNVRNTLMALLDMRVVPIINENDVVAVDEIGEKFGDNDRLSALIIALPLVSMLAMIWMRSGGQDNERIANHAESTFWFVLPTLPMFLILPWLLRHGWGFWPSLGVCCAVTVVLFRLTVAGLRGVGMDLMP